MLMKKEKKITLYVAAMVLTIAGIYNSVMINSESSLSQASFVKRLDEVTGEVKPGRKVASSWTKIEKKEVSSVQVSEVARGEVAPALPKEAVLGAVAELQGELELNLIEVINPKKWKNGIPSSEFTGSLSSNNGVIKSLNVSLPNGETIVISQSEINGNVFEYELADEKLSGIMYQVDQRSFMVNLSNGPFEGTRLNFSMGNSEEQMERDQEALAETHEVQAAEFGSPITKLNTDSVPSFSAGFTL